MFENVRKFNEKQVFLSFRVFLGSICLCATLSWLISKYNYIKLDYFSLKVFYKTLAFPKLKAFMSPCPNYSCVIENILPRQSVVLQRRVLLLCIFIMFTYNFSNSTIIILYKLIYMLCLFYKLLANILIFYHVFILQINSYYINF